MIDHEKKTIEQWEIRDTFPEPIDGHTIAVQVKYRGPHSFLYFRDEEEVPFATVDSPEKGDIPEIAVARCGDRVVEISSDEFDHLAVACWALGVSNPEGRNYD